MQPNLPTIPQPLRKAELKEILIGFPKRTVSAEIIDVIVNIRKVSLQEARNIKTLYPGEVEEILKRFQ